MRAVSAKDARALDSASSLADAVDREMALELAQELEDDELTVRAEAVRACVRSAELTEELLPALIELTEFFAHNTMPGAERRLEQARDAIVKAKGRS